MLKKKIILPFIIALALTLAACTTDDGNVDPNLDTAPVEDETQGNETKGDETLEDDKIKEYSDIKIKPTEVFDKYMEKYPDTIVKKIQMDRDMGKYVYKIEGFDNEKEYELKIDPVNGDILKEDIDTLDYDDKEEAITKANVEKIEGIVDKALKEVGEDAKLEEWTLEVENGKTLIEVEMERKGYDDFEYTYDIETGELVEKDD